jgi:hypothetical protein
MRLGKVMVARDGGFSLLKVSLFRDVAFMFSNVLCTDTMIADDTNQNESGSECSNASDFAPSTDTGSATSDDDFERVNISSPFKARTAVRAKKVGRQRIPQKRRSKAVSRMQGEYYSIILRPSCRS